MYEMWVRKNCSIWRIHAEGASYDVMRTQAKRIIDNYTGNATWDVVVLKVGDFPHKDTSPLFSTADARK